MNYFRTLLAAFVIVNLVGISLTSCIREEDYADGNGVELKFGNDTVSFDTIFTTVSSLTKTLMVYNDESKPIKIDRISLREGAASFFRLNIDGTTDLIAKDVEIGAKDSLYIFVKVELNPNNQSNPLLIEDEILFSFNGKTQSVVLQAYGQDAYYHKPTHFLLSRNSSSPSGYDTIWYSLVNEGGEQAGYVESGNEIRWKNDKPHVILGTCVVDSAFTLNLSAGTTIHLDKNSEFWVYTGGTLNATGDIAAPITFTSMRKDAQYANAAGQWGCMRFIAGCKNNVLENVVIKNNVIGILVDTCVSSSPTLTMRNTIVENCSYVGLYSRGATLDAQNLIVQNCGNYAVALTIGGNYNFVHCTFANYWQYSTRTKATLLLNDYYLDVNDNIQYRPVEQASFHNCIIYGSLAEEEVEFDLLEGGYSQKYFENCIVKTKKYASQTNVFANCLFSDPKFRAASEGDVSVGEGSVAISAGNGAWSYIVPYDIYGNLRPDPPTIGAIEYVAAQDGKRLSFTRFKRQK